MKQKARFSPGLIVLILLVLVLLNLAALSWLGWPKLQNIQSDPRLTANGSPSATASPLPETATPTTTAAPSQTPAIPTATVAAVQPGAANPTDNLNTQGLLLIALRDGSSSHLFAYHPGLLPLTRLTASAWDEIDPAVSPDGLRLAYASRQNGYWDLYTRDLVSGKTQQVTDTPDYEGKPAWSPDGQWLVCESYRSGNLDIYLISTADLSQAPIRLTEDPAADSAPAWSPQGRKVAFISTRAGLPAVWIADLDRTDDARFRPIAQDANASAAYPTWSHDGQYLAWTEEKDGSRGLVVWDSQNPDLAPSPAGPGDHAAWTPDNRYLLASLNGPNQSGLITSTISGGSLAAPMADLPGQAYGLSWKPGPIAGWLSDALARADRATPAPLSRAMLTVLPNQPPGRTALITIADISAPVPMLSDAVDEPFLALRAQAARDSGWDILSSLENAFVSVNTPNDPSIQEDWIYTGRAFAINPLILSAGWMAMVREDFNGQTFWRVYLKARYQDGSAGLPLTRPVWDVNARFAGNPQAYEQGGQTGAVPSGYWIDLTELSLRYGWERLPSRANWRNFFPAIRFNQFVYRSGLDWNAAMRELYPPEALATPTSIPTPTNTPTSTREPTRTPTEYVPSATPTPTPTRRPTLTPGS